MYNMNIKCENAKFFYTGNNSKKVKTQKGIYRDSGNDLIIMDNALNYSYRQTKFGEKQL